MLPDSLLLIFKSQWRGSTMNISSNWECWHDNDPSGTRRKQRSLDAPLGINKMAEQCDKANHPLEEPQRWICLWIICPYHVAWLYQIRGIVFPQRGNCLFMIVKCHFSTLMVWKTNLCYPVLLTHYHNKEIRQLSLAHYSSCLKFSQITVIGSFIHSANVY